ncbi:hypothetical protein O3P69_011514 [Scylla paramamosain]|uniref:Uncharacterized protein n=1 Tax=Scylla paramamosain TaxID=85552 RepID=A0AAW0T7Z4_SCYPA
MVLLWYAAHAALFLPLWRSSAPRSPHLPASPTALAALRAPQQPFMPGLNVPRQLSPLRPGPSSPANETLKGDEMFWERPVWRGKVGKPDTSAGVSCPTEEGTTLAAHHPPLLPLHPRTGQGPARACGGVQRSVSGVVCHPAKRGHGAGRPAKWRSSGHWSPPQPRPLTPQERTNSQELPRSLVNSGSWDESEPPSPVPTLPHRRTLTLQASSHVDSRPVTDGEVEGVSLRCGERRRRSDVIKEAVAKILEEKKANRSARSRGRNREGGGLPPPHPRRVPKTVTTDTDDESAEFAAYLRQRRHWRGRRHHSSTSDAESLTASQDEGSPPASPSPRPGIARRASNFLLKSFKAVSMTMRLNKKFVPTYYLSGTHELPEPDQLLNRFGHSLDSRLEERRPSQPDHNSLCVVWDLGPEDGASPSPTRHHRNNPASVDSSRESSRNASSSDLSREESPGSDTPTRSSPWCPDLSPEEHIYEEPRICIAAPLNDPTSEDSGSPERKGCGHVAAASRRARWRAGEHPPHPPGGHDCERQGERQECRGFRSLPCSPLVQPAMAPPILLHRPRQRVPSQLSPRPPASPLPPRPPQSPSPRSALSLRPPLPPRPPPCLSPVPRVVLQEPSSPRTHALHVSSPGITHHSRHEVENARNIALRRNGQREAPLFISIPRDPSKMSHEMLESSSRGSGRVSPIYAQPYASSPGPDVYSLTPTIQSPTEAAGPAGSSEDASEHHNVFFGHDFQLEQHSGRRSPSIAAYRHDCHRDSAYFSTDESTEPGAGPDILPRGPSPPFSSAFLREAIQHSLADSLHRLPEIVASEVSRQVRECLRDSTSEVAAELHKLSSTNTGSESLGPKRPSSLDLLGSPRRRHIYSYSCQDLLGDDPFPLALSHSRRSSRAGATLSVVDLDSSSDDQMCSKGVSASHWNQTTSEPSHLHHLHLEHAVAQVEVEGDVVELPFKHHQHLKEALTPLCRELSQSHLLDGKGEAGAGSTSVVLRLQVAVDQLDDNQSDTSMEWDYFDQRDGGWGRCATAVSQPGSAVARVVPPPTLPQQCIERAVLRSSLHRRPVLPGGGRSLGGALSIT